MNEHKDNKDEEDIKQTEASESDCEFYDACDHLIADKQKSETNTEKLLLENFDSSDNDENDLPDFESRPEIKKLKSRLNRLHLSDEVDFKQKESDADKNEDENKKDDEDEDEEEREDKVS